MDELQQRLDQVLSDPAAMSRIQELAASLGLGGRENASAPPPESEPPGGGLLGALGALGGGRGAGESAAAPLGALLRGIQGKEHPLSAALGPYLPEEKRSRLRRALSAASTARMAGSAMGFLGGGHGL